MITRRILSLLLCLMFVGGVLSAKTIKGIVLDDSDGEPIIGGQSIFSGENSFQVRTLSRTLRYGK